METNKSPSQAHTTKPGITTRPIIPPYSDFPTLVLPDQHIIVRPIQPSDLPAFHELRSQIEVMKWTSAGTTDANLQATRTWMSRFIDMPNHSEDDNAPAAALQREPTLNFAVVHVNPADDGENVIGVAGFHKFDPQPEIGYMIRREFWGRGVATAVLRVIVDWYWSLERVEVERPLGDASMAERETIVAIIDAANVGSRRVLEKCAFRYFSTEVVTERDTEITLAHYSMQRP